MNTCSIGIIGGADGPTAIFVTSQKSPALTISIVAAFILVCIVIIRMRKK